MKSGEKTDWENYTRELQASVEALIYNHLGGYLKQELETTAQPSEDWLPINKLAFQLAPIWHYDNTKPITRCAADNS